MNAAQQFVFGYGSLAARCEGCHVAILRGHRRGWGVAMDNAVDVPGYKYYRLRDGGSRPAVFVAFLDIERDASAAVAGLCLPVDAGRLRELDARERNYTRIDVSDAIEPVRGRVWTYRGSAAGRARLSEGIDRGIAAVSRDYLQDVLCALQAIGYPGDAAAAERLVHVGGLDVLDVERVDLPASAERGG